MVNGTMADRIRASVRERLRRVWWLALFLVAKYSLHLWLTVPPTSEV